MKKNSLQRKSNGTNGEQGKLQLDASQPLSADLLEKFLEIQFKEAQNRENELKLRELKEKNSLEFAKKSIDAQLEDREKVRQDRKTILRYVLTAGGAAIVAVLVFLGYCIHSGHWEIVQETIKLSIATFGGGAGGYAFGARKDKKTSASNAEGEKD